MLYSISRILACIIMYPIFLIKTIGKENLKFKGGCIYISNHKSNWDPLTLGISVRNKPVCYLAKEELFGKKISVYFLKKLNTIPISRNSGDIKAIKTAISALKEKKALGIFPEGTRSKNGEMLPFEQGVALIAIKAEVPVIPVYIKGNYKLFRRMIVYAGKPIYAKEVIKGKKSGEAIKTFTQHLQNTMNEMSREV